MFNIELDICILVTILIANATAMEALPVFLDKLVAPWFAVVISVTFVLIFGEIVPQAMFSSDPIKVGAKLAPLVKGLKIILYILAKPLAMLLDRCIPSRHPVYYTHGEIEAIMGFATLGHEDEKKFIRM